MKCAEMGANVLSDIASNRNDNMARRSLIASITHARQVSQVRLLPKTSE